MTFTYQRRYRGPVKLVILDWAGTTMDYGCYAPAVVFVEVYKRKGVEISMEEAREPMGAHKLVHIRKISQIPAVARRWQGVHGRPCTEDDVQAMFEEFVPLQLDCLAEYADLIPGTLDVVAELRRRGIKIGSTTGYTGEMMELLAGRGGPARLRARCDRLRHRRSRRPAGAVDVSRETRSNWASTRWRRASRSATRCPTSRRG